jgi:hypothetical protein
MALTELTGLTANQAKTVWPVVKADPDSPVATVATEFPAPTAGTVGPRSVELAAAPVVGAETQVLVAMVH